MQYNEICTNVKTNGWTNVPDASGKMGPYAYSGNQWVGYDDINMAGVKAHYIKDNQLGGGMFWDLPSDDFKNICGNGKYPLIRTVSEILKTGKTCGEKIL